MGARNKKTAEPNSQEFFPGAGGFLNWRSILASAIVSRGRAARYRLKKRTPLFGLTVPE
jgi:hypothetical protein